jgi:hypothetical protein
VNPSKIISNPLVNSIPVIPNPLAASGVRLACCKQGSLPF